MTNSIDYRQQISKRRRLAQLIPNLSNIVFEPRGDGRSFNMLWYVGSMNENVQFGVLALPKDFISFLKSGFAPRDAWGADNAYYYLSDHVLDIDRQTSEKEYNTVSNNLKILQAGDPTQINNFIHSGFPKAVVSTVVDTDAKTRNTAHNNIIARYVQWKRGNQGVSQAVPYMANRKRSLQRISHRDKQESK